VLIGSKKYLCLTPGLVNEDNRLGGKFGVRPVFTQTPFKNISAPQRHVTLFASLKGFIVVLKIEVL